MKIRKSVDVIITRVIRHVRIPDDGHETRANRSPYNSHRLNLSASSFRRTFSPFVFRTRTLLFFLVRQTRYYHYYYYYCPYIVTLA